MDAMLHNVRADEARRYHRSRKRLWLPACARLWATFVICALLTITVEAIADPPSLVIEHCTVFDSESGLPPAAALQAVTLRNATVLKEEKRLGSIAVGKLADMVLLTANPLLDIRHTRSIQLVIRGGKVCYPSQLLKKVPAE